MSDKTPVRVLLVDDHPVVRGGLHMISDIDRRLQIIGEAATVEAALARIDDLSPDVVLLDVRLAEEDGLEVCRRTRERKTQVRFLCLTSYADDDLVLSALAAGADGYLLKQNDAKHIAAAIHTVLNGGTVFDAVIAPVVASGQSRQSDAERRLRSLARGELRVLAEVAKGRTDKEAANVLNLSVKTVRNYLDHVFVKLHVRSRTEAALIYAASRGR
jgi:two-component system, NarL family, response regulator DevR